VFEHLARQSGRYSLDLAGATTLDCAIDSVGNLKTMINSATLKKAVYAATHPKCWRAALQGVIPSIEHFPFLKSIDIDGIIDVGANRGQFSLACRSVKPGVPIVAFEPNPSEVGVYRKLLGGYRDVVIRETALGQMRGTAILHISGRRDSSSLLPIGPEQNRVFPGTGEVATMEVPVALLDEYRELWPARQRQVLKIDVQGFEHPVLMGALETLRTCRYVYVECSERELYRGQVLRTGICSLLRERGFKESGCHNPLYHDGNLVQADYVFIRSS